MRRSYFRDVPRPQKEYATVTAILANRTDGAVLLDNDAWPELVWVPRGALYAVSNLAVDRARIKDKIALQIELKTAQAKKIV